MHIPGVNLARNTLASLSRDIALARTHRQHPARYVLNDVALELGPWASDRIRYALYHGAYEENERQVLAATLRSDDVVLEVGCGTGYITTIAARRAAMVTAFDADPALVAVARDTTARNGVTVDIQNGVLERAPTHETTPFYVDPIFWISSLQQREGARRVDVPVFPFLESVNGATYLLLDIEGAETTLLAGDLPGIRAICVECHPGVSTPAEITAMLESLFAQGFALDLAHSRENVLFLAR